MGDEGEELSQGRCMVRFFSIGFPSTLAIDIYACTLCQIVNVWRPLAYPAVDCPLAAMDYRTLNWEDLKATDLILQALPIRYLHLILTKIQVQRRREEGRKLLGRGKPESGLVLPLGPVASGAVGVFPTLLVFLSDRPSPF